MISLAFSKGFFKNIFLQEAFGWMLLSHMHRKFLWNISCFFHAVHLCSASSNGFKIFYRDIRLSLKKTIKITGPNLMNKHLFNIKIKNVRKLSMSLVWSLCCWYWTGFSKRGNLFANFFCFQKHICIRDLKFIKYEDHHGRLPTKVCSW